MSILQVQCLLAYLGYDPGKIDGMDGANTRKAVKAFQADFGIKADGIAGEATQKALRHAVAYGMPEREPEEAPTNRDETAQVEAAQVEAAQYLQADGCYHIPRGVDVQLTRNFRASEIHCQGVGCCQESIISKRIMDLAQEIRDDLGEPLTIGSSGGSGYRCKKHNAEVRGAAPNSLHTISEAVDLHYRDPDKLLTVVLRHLKDGEVGKYPWGCHVGCWDRGFVNRFNG